MLERGSQSNYIIDSNEAYSEEKEDHLEANDNKVVNEAMDSVEKQVKQSAPSNDAVIKRIVKHHIKNTEVKHPSSSGVIDKIFKKDREHIFHNDSDMQNFDEFTGKSSVPINQETIIQKHFESNGPEMKRGEKESKRMSSGSEMIHYENSESIQTPEYQEPQVVRASDYQIGSANQNENEESEAQLITTRSESNVNREDKSGSEIQNLPQQYNFKKSATELSNNDEYNIEDFKSIHNEASQNHQTKTQAYQQDTEDTSEYTFIKGNMQQL